MSSSRVTTKKVVRELPLPELEAENEQPAAGWEVESNSPITDWLERGFQLPEWNLADLYSGIDAPQVTRDLAKMAADCVAFETDCQGKLAEFATTDNRGGCSFAAAARGAL